MKVRLVAAGILAGCACVLPAAASTGVSPSSDAPASLRDLVRGWTRPTSQLPPRAAAGMPAQTRADALAALWGGRRADARCAAPLLIALYQHGSRLNQPTRQWLDQLTRVPAVAGSSARLSPGGEFRVHYTTDPQSSDRVESYDGDLNGVPDGVDRIAAELTDTLADFVHALDWAPAPLPGQASVPRGSDGVVDVYLVGSLGAEGPRGFVMPRGAGWPSPGTPLEERVEPPEAADAAIYLDARLASSNAVSREAVAHMLAHVVLLRESARESPWWHEASATWLENRLTRDAAAVAATFARGASSTVARAPRGLSDDLPGMSLEAFLWPHYLIQSGGSDASLLRRLWEEMAAVPGNNTFDAMDRLLRRGGSSLSEEIGIFNTWNLFLGRADDGRHYAFAGLLPTPQGDATYDVFPARGASPAGAVPPLGSSMLRLLGDGSPGGLRIRFFGSDPGTWDVSLIVYAAASPAEARRVTVEIDASGRGFIPVPWRSLAEMDLLVQNLAPPAAAPADYYFAIDYDPSVPYDLLGFTAEDATGGAVLAWSTDGEERLAGWNIWRGAAPLGPVTRVNRFLVPAAGLAGHPMSYSYVDATVDPGKKYYYYLEGVTFDGFTERSHPAGVRTSGPSAQSTPR